MTPIPDPTRAARDGTITARHLDVRRQAKDAARALGHCMGIYRHRYEGERHIVYSVCCFCGKRIEVVSGDGLPRGYSRGTGGALTFACVGKESEE